MLFETAILSLLFNRGRRVKNCEKLNCSSSGFIDYPSSVFVSSEVEYLNRIDSMMEESKIYEEPSRQKCEDVRLKKKKTTIVHRTLPWRREGLK